MQFRLDVLQHASAFASGQLVAGQLELTSECFQKCRLCDSWREDQASRSHWKLEEVKRLLSDLAQYPSFQVLTLTGGDPQHWPYLQALLTWLPDFQKNIAGLGSNLIVRMNTALTQDCDLEVWSQALDRVRVSLDAWTPATYKLMRGDDTRPADVCVRIQSLIEAGVTVDTQTTVSKENVHEVAAITQGLQEFFGNRLRKANFMLALGPRGTHTEETLRTFVLQRAAATAALDLINHGLRLSTSFIENPLWAEQQRMSSEMHNVPCSVRRGAFHLKANGDWFGCCLTGGEALPTQQHHCYGNYHQTKLESLHRYGPDGLPSGVGEYYGDEACRSVCQWKQLSINLAASNVTPLAIP